jgi:hypothetical protein
MFAIVLAVSCWFFCPFWYAILVFSYVVVDIFFKTDYRG